MSKNETAELYQEFLDFRAEWLKDAIDRAWYTDERDGVKVRPVVPLGTVADLLRFNKALRKWRDYVNRLTTLDPIRFDKNASVFTPEPRLIREPANIRLVINKATSTRTRSREDILRQLRSYREKLASRADHGDQTETLINLDREIAFFEKDDCEKYRLRNPGFNDIILVVTYTEKGKDGKAVKEKVRVPHAGVYVYDPLFYTADREEIAWLMGKKQSGKIGAIEMYGLQPIPCSLGFSGQLYRADELDLGNAARGGDAAAATKLNALLESRKKK